MRRAMILLVAVATLMVIPGVASAADPADAFEGTWTSIDIDKSKQTLVITKTGPTTVDLALYDDGGTICGEFDPRNGRPTQPLEAFASGDIGGGVLSFTAYDILCLPDGPDFPDFGDGFEYTIHRGGNKMSDNTGVKNWIRRRNP